jgi:hypothetical protein
MATAVVCLVVGDLWGVVKVAVMGGRLGCMRGGATSSDSGCDGQVLHSPVRYVASYNLRFKLAMRSATYCACLPHV